MSVHVHGQYNRAPFDGWAGDYALPGQYKVTTNDICSRLILTYYRIIIIQMRKMQGQSGTMITQSLRLA